MGRTTRNTNNRIVKQHLILCEGRDAEEFLIAYLNSAALKDHDFFSNEIQVMNFGGNEDLYAYLSVLQNMEGFHDIKSLLIIRDAETNARAAIDQIITPLRATGFDCPDKPYVWGDGKIKTAFLLFPTCSADVTEGTLEDLCLSILRESNHEEILVEIDSFMVTLENHYKRKFPHKFKTKLHTYFSVTDDYISLKIGEAARAHAFDWTHPNLVPLKEFILEIAT